MLAVLKCGAGFVPLDPDYPLARLRFIVDDAGLRAVIGSTIADSARVAGDSVRHVGLDADHEAIAAHDSSPLDTMVREHDVAYVMYTSGSTGGQGRAVDTATWSTSWRDGGPPGLTADDVLLAVTTLSFDIAGWNCSCR